MPMSDEFHREVFGEQPRASDRSARRQSTAGPSRRQSGVDFERMRRDAQRLAKKTAQEEAKRAARRAARAADSWSAELLGLNRDLRGGLFDGWGWLGKPVGNHLTSRKGDRSVEDRIADELGDFFSGPGWKW